MVEEHVGKRRRKEVRQAIAMKQRLRSSLLVILIILALGIIAAAAMAYLLVAGAALGIDFKYVLLLLGVIIVVLLFLCPRTAKWWNLYGDYKKHLDRFNITKDDMAALQRDEA